MKKMYVDMETGTFGEAKDLAFVETDARLDEMSDGKRIQWALNQQEAGDEEEEEEEEDECRPLQEGDQDYHEAGPW